MTSKKCLDFVGDPDHRADTGILKVFLPQRDKGNSNDPPLSRFSGSALWNIDSFQTQC